QTADFVVTSDGVGGGCNHMPPNGSGGSRPKFWDGLKGKNHGAAPVKVEVQRIFWSENLSLLGSVTDKITARIDKDGPLVPLPCGVEPGKEQRIALVYPIMGDDPHGSGKLNITVILSVGGERLFVPCMGEFRIHK